MQSKQEQIKVWDPLVRIGHWTLAAAFFIAYFTAEELEGAHVTAGYWVGAYVAVRIVWGFVGSRHARFSDFVRGPKATLAYLFALIRGNSRRYLGHNPAGGAMIVALLVCLAATVTTGLAVEADTENEGPLATWLRHPATSGMEPTTQKSALAESAPAAEESDVRKPESRFEEIHELFANLTLALVILHVLGVMADTWIHRENIVRAMITGYKARTSSPASSSGQGGSRTRPRAG